MKFSDVSNEIKPYMEYACIVCMAGQRLGNNKYEGCSCRNIAQEYCPWQEEVYIRLTEQSKSEDIFSNWLKIANLQLEKETEKKRYINLEGLK